MFKVHMNLIIIAYIKDTFDLYYNIYFFYFNLIQSISYWEKYKNYQILSFQVLRDQMNLKSIVFIQGFVIGQLHASIISIFKIMRQNSFSLIFTSYIQS